MTWKQQIAAWLRQWANRLDPPPVETDALAVAARSLVAQAELLQVSGEYKRHQVYAKLIRAFPARPHRDIGYEIERAVRALGDRRG